MALRTLNMNHPLDRLIASLESMHVYALANLTSRDYKEGYTQALEHALKICRTYNITPVYPQADLAEQPPF